MRNTFVGREFHDPLKTLDSIRSTALPEQGISKFPMRLREVWHHLRDLAQMLFRFLMLVTPNQRSAKQTANLRVARVIPQSGAAQLLGHLRVTAAQKTERAVKRSLYC